MPAYRHYDCARCEVSIDTEYDTYYPLSCLCCYVCEECSEYEDRERAREQRNAERAQRRRDAQLIHSYSYKPYPYKPKGNYPTEALLGVELEVGAHDKYDIARITHEIDPNENHLYCKSDCSVYGTEIVMHPMTLKWAKEWDADGNYPNAFKEMLSKLRGKNCWTNPCQCGQYSCNNGWECQCGDESNCYTCRDRHETGLHIHVSRNAFKQLRKRARGGPERAPFNETYEQRIGRQQREMVRQQREQQAINHQMIWIMFLERNDDKIAGATKLARRDSTHYAKFKKSDLDEIRQKGDGQFFGEGRYMAINCENDKTYELRFFSSTLDEEEFFAALEFADASVEYTRTLNANDVLRNRGLEWSKFVEYVNTAKYDDGKFKYPNLYSQMATLGIN